MILYCSDYIFGQLIPSGKLVSMALEMIFKHFRSKEIGLVKVSSIFADEPSGNLDHKNAKEFFKLLFNLKSKNRIIIYATHNRYFANLADCRLQLINGKLKSINARK